MEAYSLDLRERICAACDEGLETRQEVADRFGVGRWFVQKLLRQRQCRRRPWLVQKVRLLCALTCKPL
jgi:transposase